MHVMSDMHQFELLIILKKIKDELNFRNKMQDISHEISRGEIFPFQCSKNKISNFYRF